MSTTLKEGDLLNIVKDDYRKSNSATAVLIEQPSADEQTSRLRGREIFKINHQEFHKSLTDLGVNVGHYTLQAIKVESLHFPPDRDDTIVVNGKYEIPDGPTKIRRNILETYFFDEEKAKMIATQLNEVELEKLVELQDLVSKARDNMEDVVKNKRV